MANKIVTVNWRWQLLWLQAVMALANQKQSNNQPEVVVVAVASSSD